MSCCCNPLVAPSSGGGPPLSNVFFVDQAAATGGDGSIGKPYNTLLAAVTAHAAGGTFILTPYDYSAETIPALADGNWSFWGAQLGAVPGGFAPFVVPTPAPPTFLPALTIGAGGSASQISFRSVTAAALTVRQSCAVLLQDCSFDAALFDTAADGSATLRAERCFFNSSGVGGSALGDCQFNDCGFWGSQTILTNGTNVQITRSYGQTNVTFSGAAGTVNLDPFSRAAIDMPVLTNGSRAVVGLPVQSITGGTLQDQLDSLVAAGVALGLWTDDRSAVATLQGVTGLVTVNVPAQSTAFQDFSVPGLTAQHRVLVNVNNGTPAGLGIGAVWATTGGDNLRVWFINATAADIPGGSFSISYWATL